MGITIHYELSVDNEAKIDRIKDKWGRYAEELDLAGAEEELPMLMEICIAICKQKKTTKDGV